MEAACALNISTCPSRPVGDSRASGCKTRIAKLFLRAGRPQLFLRYTSPAGSNVKLPLAIAFVQDRLTSYEISHTVVSFKIHIDSGVCKRCGAVVVQPSGTTLRQTLQQSTPGEALTDPHMSSHVRTTTPEQMRRISPSRDIRVAGLGRRVWLKDLHLWKVISSNSPPTGSTN